MLFYYSKTKEAYKKLFLLEFDDFCLLDFKNQLLIFAEHSRSFLASKFRDFR